MSARCAGVDRYVITTPAGEPVIQTNSPEAAAHWQAKLGGQVIDREAVAA